MVRAHLALFVYSLLPLFAATGSSAALSRNLAQQIRQNIERAEMSTGRFPCPSLLLWVLVMGAFICTYNYIGFRLAAAVCDAALATRASTLGPAVLPAPRTLFLIGTSPAAEKRRDAVLGVRSSKVKDLSGLTVTRAGIGVPGTKFAVRALNSCELRKC